MQLQKKFMTTLTSSKSSLEEQLQEISRLLEDKKEQLKKSKEQQKLVEQELETFRLEGKRREKMVRIIWKDSGLRIPGLDLSPAWPGGI